MHLIRQNVSCKRQSLNTCASNIAKDALYSPLSGKRPVDDSRTKYIDQYLAKNIKSSSIHAAAGMSGSSFGTLYKVTTFGESHCEAVGCIVDGCPAGISLTPEIIQKQLDRRRPGQSRLTTPRTEVDKVHILSGVEAGLTLGTPIALVVYNENTKPGDYGTMQTIPRPGHADYTYHMKYGIHAASGGGRSSARETIGRVAAGTIAEYILNERWGCNIVTFVSSVGTIDLPEEHLRRSDGTPWSREDVDQLGTLRILRDYSATGWKIHIEKKEQDRLDALDEAAFVLEYCRATGEAPEGLEGMAGYAANTPAYEDFHHNIYDMMGNLLGMAADAEDSAPSDAGLKRLDVAAARSSEVLCVRCPHAATAARMASLIRLVKAKQDSTGGVLTTIIHNVPIGLGEPVFDKLEAKLAHAMMSLPATKAFEIGSGFSGSRMRGSKHNDNFIPTTVKATASGALSKVQTLLRTATNNAGGTLGGISNGADIVFRVAIKPVSTIGQPQTTATYTGETAVLEAKGRHDPCVLPRAPPLVEGMAALVIMDAAMIQQTRAPLQVLPPPEVSAPDAVAGSKRKYGEISK